MSVTANLAKARSNIVFILGLVTAAAIVVAIERSDLGAGAQAARTARAGEAARAAQRQAPLTPAQREAATYAWARLRETAPARALDRVDQAEALGVAGAPHPETLSPAAAEAVMDALARR